MMVEVFKTDVQLQRDAMLIVANLEKNLSNAKINFDMEDCDKILRIEGTNPTKNKFIINYLQELGYNCEILD